MVANKKRHLSAPEATIFPPFPKLDSDASMKDRLQAFGKWVQATRIMRTVKHWSQRRASMLAGGMAYMGLFSGFAGLWVFFSIAALVLTNNKELMAEMLEGLGDSIPGLVGENGVIKPEMVMNIDGTAALSVSGSIALASMLWTALNFLNGARLAIRAMFDLPAATTRNLVLTKLGDLGLLIAFVVGLLLSLAFTAASSGVVEWVFNDLINIELPAVASVLIRVTTTVVMLLFDALVIATILRVLSAVRIPMKVLWQGALIGAVLVGILKFLGSALLGGASSNPLLVTFAALIGVLIFMNFMCQVLLFAASWVAVTMDDAGYASRLLTAEEAEEITRATELQARRERLATDRIRAREELESTPRWRRRKARRNYERIVAEQERLEHEALTERLGMDPLKVKAQQEDVDVTSMRITRDDGVDTRRH
nr:YihY/virulence factor BrkB family protein [Pseudoclavibacter sp. Marseille-Q3772]